MCCVYLCCLNVALAFFQIIANHLRKPCKPARSSESSWTYWPSPVIRFRRRPTCSLAEVRGTTWRSWRTFTSGVKGTRSCSKSIRWSTSTMSRRTRVAFGFTKKTCETCSKIKSYPPTCINDYSWYVGFLIFCVLCLLFRKCAMGWRVCIYMLYNQSRWFSFWFIPHFNRLSLGVLYRSMPGYDRPHRKIETCAVEGLPVPSHPGWKCRWRSQKECRGTYGHIRRVSRFSSASPKQCCSQGGPGPRRQWDHERFVFDLGWVLVLSQLHHRRESSKSVHPGGVSSKGFARGWFRPKDVCGETWRIWVEQREGLQECSKEKLPHKRPACLWHFSCIDSAVALSALAYARLVIIAMHVVVVKQ